MKRRVFLPIVMLAAGCMLCGAKGSMSSRRGLGELKRELAQAQKELSRTQTRINQLEEAIAQKEIQRIQEQIGKIEMQELTKLLQSREERLAFFSDQRETLSTIIRNHPICALEAQAVLDQILTLITHISDEAID